MHRSLADFCIHLQLVITAQSAKPQDPDDCSHFIYVKFARTFLSKAHSWLKLLLALDSYLRTRLIKIIKEKSFSGVTRTEIEVVMNSDPGSSEQSLSIWPVHREPQH